MNNSEKKAGTPRFAFFGTPEFAVTILDELERAGFLPALVVTTPDRPQGRGLTLTPPPVKAWAQKHNIPTLQPEKLGDDFLYRLRTSDYQLFVVAAYGKLIPKAIIELPRHGALNVHPSLLPKYRGPSPIEAQILNDDREVGVTIMRIDEKMDHGPIVTSNKVRVASESWPLRASELGEMLFRTGGKLLVDTIPKWVAGEMTPVPQSHQQATYCSLIAKEDAELEMKNGMPTNTRENFLKIRAYDIWPKAYFFADTNGKKIRVKITDAGYKDDNLIITKVIPEGRKEMTYEVFLKSVSGT